MLTRGVGVFAVVDIKHGSDLLPDEHYYVHTTIVEHKIQSYTRTLSDALEKAKLPNDPQFEWVRPMTRRLQRLFGWGGRGDRPRRRGARLRG